MKNTIKQKAQSAALTLLGAAVLWFGGWGALMFINLIMEWLHI